MIDKQHSLHHRYLVCQPGKGVSGAYASIFWVKTLGKVVGIGLLVEQIHSDQYSISQ